MDFPIAFFNGQHLPKEKICISPDDRGFLFGDGTYEVIRIYHGKPFRLTRHIERLRYSTEAIRLPFSNFKQIEELAYTLIQKNNLQNGEAMLYIQITQGVATRSHAFPFETFPTVYASLFPVLDYSKQRKEGVGVILVPDLRWQKCNIKSISLLANVLASQEAFEQHAHEAIFVREGYVTEGTHTNVCAVFNGIVKTPPLTTHLLNGITREVILELCPKLEIPVEETPISETAFKHADEIIILGTLTEIMPAIKVNNIQIANGKPGPVTLKLQKAFNELISSS